MKSTLRRQEILYKTVKMLQLHVHVPYSEYTILEEIAIAWCILCISNSFYRTFAAKSKGI